VDACGCGGLAAEFDAARARQDRERYRRSGPDKTTRLLLELLTPYRSSGSTVLDIGGGIGIVDLELLRAGAGHATLVDASTAYIAVARDEARRAGLLDRIDFVEGDFVRRAPTIDRAEVVTLDRVICCYPDMETLVAESSGRARTAYGVVMPRERWFGPLIVRTINLTYRLRRRSYRFFVHPTARVDEIVAANGLKLRAERRTRIWRVAVYDRAQPT
jgi:tRNA1(Val) A37 N6-methylase TrmN6